MKDVYAYVYIIIYITDAIGLRSQTMKTNVARC